MSVGLELQRSLPSRLCTTGQFFAAAVKCQAEGLILSQCPSAYHLLDVFTDRVFGGNPLAVFPEAPPLDDATMQRIAAELNLSETVFVYPAERPDSDCRLRIFHAADGAAVCRSSNGRHRDRARGARPCAGAASGEQSALLRLHENAGVVRVVVDRRPAGMYAELQVPQTPRLESVPLPRAVLADLIGLTPADLAPAPDDPCAASAGVPFLIIPVASTSALERAQLDASLWKAHVADAWAPHVYVLHRENARVRARMFAPAMGIAEDPATGRCGRRATRVSGAPLFHRAWDTCVDDLAGRGDQPAQST
jgi:trans-2,3-dihydro-3-hydroxyanthranilate isomerase